MPAQTNGHGPTASGTISRSSSFAPITPVVKERVGDVANRLSEVEKIIEDLNLQSATSATRSPTMGDLQQEIDLLKKDIELTKAAQKKQIDDLRNDVKKDVKEQVTKTMQPQIKKKITESIEAQVKIEVGEWGQSLATKKLVENLRGMVQENDILHKEARIKLGNSRSRHENSTLDEHADFETNLAKITLPDGEVSGAYPRTLKELFSYDERQLLQLFDEYGLRRLDTHLENLNRFLAFIGLRFSIPEQSVDILDEPPAYPSYNVLEPSKEKPQKDSPASPSNQGEKETEVTPEVKPKDEGPPQEPAAVNNNPAQAQMQENQLDEKQAEEKHEVKRDRGGQKPAEIELSAFTRQPPAAAMTQRFQQAAPTYSARATNRNLFPTSPQAPSNPQGPNSRTGWFKSLTDNFQ